MYLDQILGSKTKVNALASLVSNPKRSFLESELSSESGSSVSEINRQLKDLVKTGIITMERVGRNKIYRINKKHFLFNALKNLFLDLEKIYRKVSMEITSYITKKYDIIGVILFGSLTKGTLRDNLVENPSDIDIAIICNEKIKEKVKLELIDFIATTIIEKYGILVYPILFSEKEYKQGLKNNPLIIEIHSKGELIHGIKPRKTG